MAFAIGAVVCVAAAVEDLEIVERIAVHDDQVGEGEGGVVWTIKEGEVFDAQALLAKAEWYVEEAKSGSQ